MKNIQILPTNKPSRLWLDSGVYYLHQIPTTLFRMQNIYITSDEDIKIGDWVIEFQKNDKIGEVHFINGEYVIAIDIQKKIILTTDQDLIEDGVQAIDDEFLEWFVKNPSCEEVKVEKYHGINTSIAEISAVSGNDDYNWKGRCDLRDYKIIIPKEEPKQETTLEEVAERIFSIPDDKRGDVYFGSDIAHLRKGFKLGAKWQQNQYGLVEIELRHTKRLLASCETALEERDRQQQRSYTLEQISKEFVGEGKSGGYFDDFLDYRLESSNKITFQQWFEQFKKK